MLQNQSENEIEEKIATLFEAIHFEKPKNQKIFAKWKSNYLHVIDSTLFNQTSDFISTVHQNGPASPIPTYQDQVQRRQAHLKERRVLADQLEEVNQVLKKEGEEVAEKLLRKYSQTLPDTIKWFALIILFVMLMLFVNALIK